MQILFEPFTIPYWQVVQTISDFDLHRRITIILELTWYGMAGSGSTDMLFA